jgi:AraC-like DNA-binding protein
MEKTISAPTAAVLYKLMEFYGLDSDAIYQAEGISKDDFNNSEKRISHKTVNALWKKAEELISDPCYGLSAAKIWRPSDLGVLGYAWLASSSLRTALNRLSRYLRIATDLLALSLSEQDDSLVLEFDFKDNKTPFIPQIDGPMAIVLEMCRINYIDPLNPLSVSLTHSANTCQSEYYAYYRCPINFDQSVNTIVLPLDAIDKTLPSSNPYLAQLHDQIMIKYLSILDKESIIDQTKKIIAEILPSGELSDQKVADELHLSSRSLQRRLNDNDTTFKQLLRSVREELAYEFLLNKDYSLSEIAFQLGFSEQSSFTRAFKHWTGQTPGKFHPSETLE